MAYSNTSDTLLVILYKLILREEYKQSPSKYFESVLKVLKNNRAKIKDDKMKYNIKDIDRIREIISQLVDIVKTEKEKENKKAKAIKLKDINISSKNYIKFSFPNGSMNSLSDFISTSPSLITIGLEEYTKTL